MSPVWLQRLFSPPVRVASMCPDDVDIDDATLLRPPEHALLKRAVPKRRREFTAGRVLARALLEPLGVDRDFSLLRGERGAPIWPPGIVGSITHTQGVAAVAVARPDPGSLRAIGLDVEQDEPLRAELRHLVCTPDEQANLEALAPEAAGVVGKAMFCSKEALYKAQYPLTRTFLGFDAVDIDVDLERERFSATFRVDAAMIARGTRWEGRLLRVDGVIAASLEVLGDDTALEAAVRRD